MKLGDEIENIPIYYDGLAFSMDFDGVLSVSSLSDLNEEINSSYGLSDLPELESFSTLLSSEYGNYSQISELAGTMSLENDDIAICVAPYSASRDIFGNFHYILAAGFMKENYFSNLRIARTLSAISATFAVVLSIIVSHVSWQIFQDIKAKSQVALNMRGKGVAGKPDIVSPEKPHDKVLVLTQLMWLIVVFVVLTWAAWASFSNNRGVDVSISILDEMFNRLTDEIQDFVSVAELMNDISCIKIDGGYLSSDPLERDKFFVNLFNEFTTGDTYTASTIGFADANTLMLSGCTYDESTGMLRI